LLRYLILDRGFYSEANIGELLDKRYHFTIAVPSGRKWVQDVIDIHYESISSPSNYRQIDDLETQKALCRILLHSLQQDKRSDGCPADIQGKGRG
jgi:hypothetical protein